MATGCVCGVCVLCVFCDGGGGRGRFPKPVHCSTSGSNCCFLTCIQFATVCCDPLKVFGVVNKAEVDVFLELSCFFYDPTDVSNLTSGSSAFSKFNLNIWKFSVHVLLKPHLENFQHYLACVWDEYNCAVVWKFFCIAFLWDWNENWSFESCGHCWVFHICWHIECSTFTASSFRIFFLI